VVYLFFVRLVIRSLLSLSAAAVLLGGCTQTADYYEVDNAGRFVKIDALPGHQASGATYIINGRAFQYDFEAIGRGEIRDPGPTSLAPGEYKRTFYKLRDAPIFSTGRAIFGGIIRRPRAGSLTAEAVESKRDSGGETETTRRKNSAATVQHREVNGRRWLVTTRFQDRERQIVMNRTYSTVISGLLITLYVDLDASSRSKPEWAQQCLYSLDRLVSDFRSLGTQPT
jgi:hypothetical protein